MDLVRNGVRRHSGKVLIKVWILVKVLIEVLILVEILIVVLVVIHVLIYNWLLIKIVIRAGWVEVLTRASLVELRI